jgi:uncharacterized membrane-anchored protein
MKQHGTYQRAVTLSDLPEGAREALVASLDELFEDSVEVEVTESPNGIAELRLSEAVPAARRRHVLAAIRDHVGVELADVETVVLDQRVSWPEPRYEVCIDFE